jgi:formylglycine-generating enzyme required for sulfatase activity
MKYDNSKDALAAIMKQFGPDVLLGKLNAHFPDFASVSRATKRLVYAVYELDAAKVLKNNLTASQADKEIAIKIAIRRLTEAFIVPDMAETIIYEFAAALGWQVKMPVPASKSPAPPPQPAAASKTAVSQNQSPPSSAPPSVRPSTLTIRTTKSVMVLINGGTFTMGSPANEPERESNEIQHQVTVSSFYMGKYEVTQAEYRAVMGTNPSEFKGDNLPVENVTWYEAVEYCNRLSRQEGRTPAYTINGENVTWNFNANGYRLPTEAEWEYACRAGTTTPFNTGNNITTSQANYDGTYSGKTAVGSFAPNPWGLYDMHGNVWEWCWDYWYDYSSVAQTNPRGASSGTGGVLRGGSWYNSAQLVRSAFRNYSDPAYRNFGIGFRLARN